MGGGRLKGSGRPGAERQMVPGGSCHADHRLGGAAKSASGRVGGARNVRPVRNVPERIQGGQGIQASRGDAADRSTKAVNSLSIFLQKIVDIFIADPLDALAASAALAALRDVLTQPDRLPYRRPHPAQRDNGPARDCPGRPVFVNSVRSPRTPLPLRPAPCPLPPATCYLLPATGSSAPDS